MGPQAPHRRRPWSCSCTACRAELQVAATRGVVILPIAVILILVPVTAIGVASTEHMSAPVAFAASLAADAIAVAYLYAFLQLRFTLSAYTHHDSDDATVPVDWKAADWSAIGDRLRAAGVNLGEIRAIKTFSGGLNLSTVHQSQNPPGVLGRMSLWVAPRHRRLMILGIVVGLAASVISQVFPSVNTTADRATGWSPVRVLIAAGLAGLLLVAIYSVTVMIRRNITSPRFAIAIPSGWRRHFAGQPAQAAAVLYHEFSHLRHRDVLQRRIIVTLGNWTSFASVFSALMAAGIGARGKQDLTILIVFPLMTVAATALKFQEL